MKKNSLGLGTEIRGLIACLLLVMVPLSFTHAQEKRLSVQDWVNALKPLPKTRSLGPGSPAPQPAQQSTSLIQFEFNSDRLTPTGKAVTDDVAQALKMPELANVKFRIEGHTDAKGAEEYNQVLSERRAKSVREYLVKKHGIAPDRIAAAGKGMHELQRPDAPFSQENRRVSFVEMFESK